MKMLSRYNLKSLKRTSGGVHRFRFSVPDPISEVFTYRDWPS